MAQQVQATLSIIAQALGVTEDALAQLVAEATTTVKAACGQPLFTKEGVCSDAATTTEGTCGKHTAAKRAAHEARVIADTARQVERSEKANAFLNARADEVRGRIGQEGCLVILTKYNGTVTGRSRRDLSALGVRGLTKTTPVAEAVAKAQAMGLKVETKAALAAE